MTEPRFHNVMPGRSGLIALGLLTLALLPFVVFWLSGRGEDEVAGPPETPVTTTLIETDTTVPEDCPVTIPDSSFTPPEGFPSVAADPDRVWYGTDDLWTVISTDGISEFERSVWWSSSLRSPADETTPAITVEFVLLGDETEKIVNENVTTGRTPDDGTFMSVGSQPDIQGCWEVTARYGGASLSYVYYSAEGRPLTIEVPNLIGLKVTEAMDLLQESEIYVFFGDSTDFTPDEEVCAQRPEAGARVRRFANVEILSAETGEECAQLPPPVLVPDVVGLPIDIATTRLTDVGISSFVDFHETNRVVCAQDPTAGTEILPIQHVSLTSHLPGGCEELLKPTGLYSQAYQDEEGRERLGTDCPAADVIVSNAVDPSGELPAAGETSMNRVDSLVEDDGSALPEQGVIDLQILPRAGEVWEFAENGDVIVLVPDDDYLIKATIDGEFDCPLAPYFWNGIPIAFVFPETE